MINLTARQTKMSTPETDAGAATPTLDQQVNFMSSSTSPPLQACVVQIWPDGLVDLVVTDPSVLDVFKVRRVPFVAADGTNTPVYAGDTRYAQALAASSDQQP
ncbi:hypothetical protein HDG34_003091 [Paraburkholderia sp. HC6.4b]|uniref:hypothetical protein n=1 Tax=unclassified Paraburkholderia TaxID=2615204 RepID=UPI0016223590|nr:MULTISPECIES: hypothetical protein [unclassified Paraburkholderia]MBB5409150.1 hypothetical protein [Paraburkholderia sp. HC6.4b]MBB5450878.1 hypothetical protein [Paraburkholderia sp. Kb1A]